MDDKVSFLAFCNLCEHLNRLGKIEQKKQKLIGFIEEWRRDDPGSLYSFIRLLLPHMDNERENYGLKENKLAELYISALALPRDSQDAQSLRNWQQSRHKDFADVLFAVLKDRLGEDFSEATSKRSKLSSSTSLSVRGVNQLLDEISLHHLIEERRDIFLKMTAKMSASEQKWLTRIILKGLRVGLPDGQVLKLLHPDAPAIYDVRMNLSELVRLFQDPKSGDTYDRDAQLQVKLFYPFKPMLAERQPLEKAAKTLNGSFYIEPKLDGERCLLHFESSSSSGNNSTSNESNSTFRYFSRQGTEFTYLYGRNGSEGSLTPKIVIEDPFYEQVASVVLDGEMVVYDPLIDKYLPFGTLKSSAGARYDPSRGQDCEPHPCLVIFDVVYYNGQSLLNWTLTERISLLHEKVIKTPIKGYLDLISRSKLLSSTEDITTALDEIIQDQGEGLILKGPLTPYIPAHRSTHWIKIKPEYVQGLCDDLDVVIIGAWYGRSGNIKEAYGKANEFLCGIWSDDKSGYNSHEWSMLNQKLEPVLIKSPAYSATRQDFISELRGADRPDLIVSDPSRSVVVQIKGSQLLASGTYKSLGLTLRFPRFMKLRLDRNPDSSLKVSELMKLYQVSAGTLAMRSSTTVNTPIEAPKSNRPKGKMATAIQRAISELPQANPEVKSYDKVPLFLEGYEVLVLNGSDAFSKAELEQKISSFGARIVQSPSDKQEEFIAVAGKDCGVRVKNFKALKTHDLLDADAWLQECQRLHSLPPPHSKLFFFITEDTKSILEARKGNYQEIKTNAELKEALDSLEPVKNDSDSVAQVCEQFRLHSIDLPSWTRGHGEVVPLPRTDNSNPLSQMKIRFEQLKLEFIRSVPLYND